MPFSNNGVVKHDVAALFNKVGLPVFGDDEPIYYDCDFSAKRRSFDLRGMTIREELYGEV